MAYVYRHIRLDTNEPFYIGIGSDTNYSRAKEKCRRSSFWKKIINKSEYRVEILVDDVSFEYAKTKEIEFIKLYGRKDLNTGTLCNLTDGGDGMINLVFTETHRKKISDKMKGRKLSESHLKSFLEFTKLGIWTEERKQKLKDGWAKSTYITPDHVREFRSKRMKENNPNKDKNGAAAYNFKGNVFVYKDGILIGEFVGIVDIEKKLNLNRSKISACLNGRRNTHKGYTFKRISNVII